MHYKNVNKMSCRWVDNRRTEDKVMTGRHIQLLSQVGVGIWKAVCGPQQSDSHGIIHPGYHIAASGIDPCILYPYTFVEDPVKILQEHLMLYRLQPLPAFITSSETQVHW